MFLGFICISIYLVCGQEWGFYILHVWSQNKHNRRPNCTSSLESSCIPVRTVVLHHSVTQMLQAKSIKQWFAIDVRCANLALTKPCPKKCVPKLKQPWVDTHPQLTFFLVCHWTPAIPGFSSARDPQWFLLVGPWIWSQDDVQKLDFGWFWILRIRPPLQKKSLEGFLSCPLLHAMILWGYFKLPNSGYCMDGISACWEGRHFLFCDRSLSLPLRRISKRSDLWNACMVWSSDSEWSR